MLKFNTTFRSWATIRDCDRRVGVRHILSLLRQKARKLFVYLFVALPVMQGEKGAAAQVNVHGKAIHNLHVAAVTNNLLPVW